MQLWLAIHLPTLDLDTHSLNWRTESVAVVAFQRIRDSSPLARQAGIQPGMRVQDAHLLDHRTRWVDWSARQRHRGWQAVIRRLRIYTPHLVEDGDTVLLDIGASLSLFGGPRELLRHARHTLKSIRLPGAGAVQARFALAPTAAGAGLLARAPSLRVRHALNLNTLTRRLDTLPCAHLPAAQAHLVWLHGIGCRHLGTLRQLPRGGVQRRTHPALLQALDAAYGLSNPPVPRSVEAPVFFQRCELPAAIEHHAGLMHVAQRLLTSLCQWLRARHLACTRLTLILWHETGRRTHEPTLLVLKPGTATWQAEPLRDLLAEHLRQLVLPTAVGAVGLRVRHLVARDDPGIAGLFPEPGGSPASRRQVLALLQARLGADAILRPGSLPDHRPEVANQWIPLNDTPPPRSALSPPVGPPVAERPCWLLAQPQPLPVRGHRPCLGSPLRLLQGPERIEDGWWQQLVTRDYYVAQDARGQRYWLFQERGQATGWFLHGLFA